MRPASSKSAVRPAGSKSVAIEVDSLRPAQAPEVAVARVVRTLRAIADRLRAEYESSLDSAWARLIGREPALRQCSVQTVRKISQGTTTVERVAALRSHMGGTLVHARRRYGLVAAHLDAVEFAARRVESADKNPLRVFGVKRAEGHAKTFADLALNDSPTAQAFYFLAPTGLPHDLIATVRPEPMAYCLGASWENQAEPPEWVASLLSETFTTEGEGFFLERSAGFGQSTQLLVDGIRRRYWNVGEAEGVPVWCSMVGMFVVGSPSGRWLHQCLGRVS